MKNSTIHMLIIANFICAILIHSWGNLVFAMLLLYLRIVIIKTRDDLEKIRRNNDRRTRNRQD